MLELYKFIFPPGLIAFLFTFVLGTLVSLLASQVATLSDKENIIEPWLLHPIVSSCCALDDSEAEIEAKRYSEVM